MSKRRFRIETGQYGGELTIGKIDKDFVDYFINKGDDSLLLETIQSYEWGDDVGGDPDAPRMSSFASWTEASEIEHLNGAYIDGGFMVVEVPSDGSDDYINSEDLEEFEGFHLFDREAYHEESINSDDDELPVLAFHSAEKGSFAFWFVETDGEDFDPKKFAYSTCDTNLAEIIDILWYDKIELEPDHNHSWTKGKAAYASVGYMNINHHFPMERIDQGNMWEDFDQES